VKTITKNSAKVGKNELKRPKKALNLVLFFVSFNDTYWRNNKTTMKKIDRIPDKFDFSFDTKFAYDGALGAIWQKDKTTFKIWAPLATSVVLNLYKSGNGDKAFKTVDLEEGERGVFSTELKGDFDKIYYTYDITNHGKTEYDVVDPYAKACGVDGERGMVINFSLTDPKGFHKHSIPKFDLKESVIYEVHFRDFTFNRNSGVSEKNKGKYLGLTEKGTKNSLKEATCLDHILELGANVVHLLPSYDMWSYRERELDKPQFNWGYDPRHYNIPAGPYSSDPFNGEVRIKEFKQVIQTLHENGIKVIMDVVYNHTGKTEIGFEQVVPKYYYRYKNGSPSNGSGCGNETASERAMMRKFMIDSLKHWATEYKIDGFRFDLMGLHDVETMNLIHKELQKINPNIMLYGEGWTAADHAMDGVAALKRNSKLFSNISVFSDDIRDGIKGSVFDKSDKGFIGGNIASKEKVKHGIVGAVFHDGVALSIDSFWAFSPLQQISYVSCHDDYTLFDKLSLSNPDISFDTKIAMNKLAASIIFTAQGVPFLLAGEEFLRTKPLFKNGKKTGELSENSYNLPDETNQIDWDAKTQNNSVFYHYQSLIKQRKQRKDFVLTSRKEVQEKIEFHQTTDEFVIHFTIKNSDKTLNVFHNASKNEYTFDEKTKITPLSTLVF